LKSTPRTSSAPALIAAAEKVKPESPAFVTLTYHVARLLIRQGKVDEARAKLDALLAMRDQLPLTAVNEIKRLRMSIARNLAELLEDAQRTPLGFTDTGDRDELPATPEASPGVAETPAPQPTTAKIPVAGSWGEGSEVSAYSSGNSVEGGRGGHLAVVEPPAESSLAAATPTPDPYTQHLKELSAGPLFDNDGANVLTRWLPLSLLIEAARSPTLSALLRGQVAPAAFIRAILLNNEEAARDLAPLV